MAKERVTYYLRCQPYIDSPEGILVNYLLHHPVYDSKRVAFEAFEAFWKALAYQAQSAGSEEEVRILGWDCINSLLNQVDYIRTRLELDGSQLGALLVATCNHKRSDLQSKHFSARINCNYNCVSARINCNRARINCNRDCNHPLQPGLTATKL